MIAPARSLSLCLGVLAVAAPAFAELVPREAIIVGQTDVGGPWTSAPTEARIDQAPRLAVVMVAQETVGRRIRTVYVVDDAVQPLRIGRKRVAARERRPWSALGDTAVRWSTVEPHAWRDRGAGAFHSNVSLDPAQWGKWIGYASVEYFATPLGPFDDTPEARIVPAAVVPSDPDVVDRPAEFEGLGTIRYRVEVRRGERLFASPGEEATTRTGIEESVHRVSIRRDDSYVGHLTAFLLVPEIFGSAGRGRSHQTERFVGADCADVLTGGARKAGLGHLPYSNVARMTEQARRITGALALDADGNAAEPIEGVEVGDIIRIDYGGALAGHTPRSFDHVAVLYEDRSLGPDGRFGPPDGRLDGFDRVMHMGHPRLVIVPLSAQSPATIDVLRWKKKGRR